MESTKVVFNDKYGILTLAAFPAESIAAKVGLWRNSNFSFELTRLLKYLPRVREILSKKTELKKRSYADKVQ